MQTKKKKIFCVPISIIIGKAAPKTISGMFKERKIVIKPNFFKFFFGIGKVCNHLKALPVIKELIGNIPKRIRYMITIAKKIPKRKLETNNMVPIVYVPL